MDVRDIRDLQEIALVAADAGNTQPLEALGAVGAAPPVEGWPNDALASLLLGCADDCPGYVREQIKEAARRLRASDQALHLLDFLDDWWDRGGAGEIVIRLDQPEDHVHVRCFQQKLGEPGLPTRDVFIVGVDEHVSAALLAYAAQCGGYGRESGRVPDPPVGFFTPE